MTGISLPLSLPTLSSDEHKLDFSASLFKPSISSPLRAASALGKACARQLAVGMELLDLERIRHKCSEVWHVQSLPNMQRLLA